jgi:hypothetical protein
MALRGCSNPGPGVLLEYQPGGIPRCRAGVLAQHAAEFVPAGAVRDVDELLCVDVDQLAGAGPSPSGGSARQSPGRGVAGSGLPEREQVRLGAGLEKQLPEVHQDHAAPQLSMDDWLGVEPLTPAERGHVPTRHGHLAERPEARADLFTEQVGLFPGGEVSALLDLVVVDEVGVRLLRPTPGG